MSAAMLWIEDAPAPPGLDVPTGALWVFGYGSLMWNPGFPHESVEPALIRGWHRAFCVHSAGHRGTPEWPGLVVALAPGGECRGLAFRIAERHKPATLAYLWQREMALADGYLPQPVRASLADGREVEALTFVANPRHEAYAGDLGIEAASCRIATARGARGSNRDYLSHTLDHLDQLGIDDPGLSALGRAVETYPEGPSP
jgi:cation transport protein ChaC